VTANAREAPLSAGGVVLPQYGWMAQGAGVTAYTAARGGVVVDYAETADSLFTNARNLRDWQTPRYARPNVMEFQQTGPRTFDVTYRWHVSRPLPQEETCFVHFSDSQQQGEIRFQQDHPLPVPATAWKAGQTVVDGPYQVEVPREIADGEYVWYIGLFNVQSGQRVPLEGPGDADNRVRLGTLVVRDGGATLIFVRAPATSPAEARAREHLNAAGAVVDFGAVRTDGSIALHREGGAWVLYTFPRERPFVLEFSSRRFPPPGQIASPGGATDTIAPQISGDWWRLPLNGAGVYRWR
jgi:hypothetical protein